MEITAKEVAALRGITGAGLMDCKRALVQANGNVDEAIKILREAGIAKAVKKQGRIAAEGAVGAYVEGGIGVLVEINCESDFVSKGEKFHAIVDNVAKVIAKFQPKDLDALNACKFENGTIADYITNQTATIGEKISIRRFEVYKTNGKLEAYLHMGGKIGVMLEASNFISGSETALHDVALQIAANKPEFVCESEVPADRIEKEKEIMLVQMQNDPKNASKPKEILEKIVLGKLSKFYGEVCLIKQPFVKDDSLTVEKYIGNKFKVVRFTRWEMGEGLEKRNDDFAAEVAAQIKK